MQAGKQASKQRNKPSIHTLYKQKLTQMITDLNKNLKLYTKNFKSPIL